MLAEVNWIPRESNVEADALANLDSSHFSEENRVCVEIASEKWHFLDRALTLGASYIHEARERKQSRVDGGRAKKLRDGTLRVRDPWKD